MRALSGQVLETPALEACSGWPVTAAGLAGSWSCHRGRGRKSGGYGANSAGWWAAIAVGK